MRVIVYRLEIEADATEFNPKELLAGLANTEGVVGLELKATNMREPKLLLPDVVEP